jgi:hypothetical protein
MPGKNEKLIRFLEAIQPSKTPEKLSKKDIGLNVHFDPERKQLVRTDAEQRTKKAPIKLLMKLLDPTFGKTNFDFIDIGGLLNLDEEEAPSFFESIGGFKPTELKGQTVGYTLVNKDKAIGSLKQIIQAQKEKEKQERQAQKEEKIKAKPPKPMGRDYSLSSGQIAQRIISDPELKIKLQAFIADKEVTIFDIDRALWKIYQVSTARLGPIYELLEKEGIISRSSIGTRKGNRGYIYFKLNK